MNLRTERYLGFVFAPLMLAGIIGFFVFFPYILAFGMMCLIALLKLIFWWV